MTTPEPYQNNSSASQKTNTLAIVGFILSFFLAIIGSILGVVSLSQIKKSNGAEGGKGLAIAAIIIGLIPTLILILLMVFGLVLNSTGNYGY